MWALLSSSVCSVRRSPSHEREQTRAGQEPVTKTYPVYRVPRKSSLDYAWDFPAARDKRIVLAINDNHRAIDIMEIGDLVPFKFKVRAGACPTETF